jgi:hypothetical protein
MKSSSNYDFFADLDEVGDFVRFLIQREAIPQDSILPQRLMAYYDASAKRVSPYQTGHLRSQIMDHVLRLVDKHPDLYRTFKTIRRLTHRG